MFPAAAASAPHRHTVAAERGVSYLPGPPALADAVGALEAAIDLLGQVDLHAEPDEAVRSAAVHLARQADRLAGAQLHTLDVVDRREAFRHDGCVTTASWYRSHTRLSHAEATRQTNAAIRLRRLPQLREALDDGDITFAHVAAVTDAAVPRRLDAIAACEDALVDLAMAESAFVVRRAVKLIADQSDADGSDVEPITDTGPDERRFLDLIRTFDGLVDVRGTLDPIAGERLLTLLDAFDAPDPADTPVHLRRSAGQRRADALDAAVSRLLDSGDVPVVAGNKAHIVATCDLLTLFGMDDQASRTPRLRYSGEITPLQLREIALAAKLTVVLTLGPWRVVNVGRTHRTLPSWLRAILELVHRQCRGPGCDRRITWSQAHHQHAWADGGETDLNATIPLCQAHHNLVTNAGWHVDFDPDTGICTWTGPEGQRIQVDPVMP